MKRFFKILFGVLFLMLGAVLVITTYQFNTYAPQPISHKIKPPNLEYFQESYVNCRRQFIARANQFAAEYPTVQIAALQIDSPTNSDLTIDYCYIPARQSAKRLFILSSGVHGVEGYVGSAIQQMFLNELVKETDLSQMGILLIHGINPYGFKNKRRVSESNVDLNRNCSMDPSLYRSINESYKDLDSFLNPKKKVSLTGLGNLFFHVTAIQRIIQYSMGSLRQAILQGQYQFEKGVYFGGKALEPPMVAVSPLIKEIARPYEIVFCIDLHTGYGANGILHLFPDPLKDPDKKAKIESIFEGTKIDWGDTEDFYSVSGAFTTFVTEILSDKFVLTMPFEFGTLDTQSTMGSIKALHNVLIENQGAQYGYVSAEDEEGVKSRYLEGYYPSSETWRSKVMDDARKMLRQVIPKYQKEKGSVYKLAR